MTFVVLNKITCQLSAFYIKKIAKNAESNER